ncbi:unnamed protein product [marine sediment metagenome]|uniref:CARDB domain-containing protein n=1 Tax=marine sediment metagenome TaxID=412755 RepID=X1LMY3_9ZZZZ
MTVNGELITAYVLWEGQPAWLPILSSNSWPIDTELTTAWRVRNIGDEATTFKVSFMELESAGVLLEPGEEADLYLYPVTPAAGTYSYALQVIADSEVVAEYPIEVVMAVAPIDWMTIIGPILVLGLLAGLVIPTIKKGV